MNVPWIHFYADTNCGHGCRVLERHGSIVGRSLDVLTIQLYGWDILDGRAPAPLPGEVLHVEPDELLDLGAVQFRSWRDARADELDAVLRGLGNCGHTRPAGAHRKLQTRAERARGELLRDLGVLPRHELAAEILAAEERARRG